MGKEKKVAVPEKVYTALAKKAEVEGSTPDELASKIVLEKAKGEKKSKAKEPEKKATFPAKGMVNAYGFLHLSNGVAEAFGASRGKKTPVTIDIVGTGGVAPEGALIIRKA